MQQKLIAFIGGGNMAQAIVLGLLKQGYPADKIIVNDPNEEKRHFFAQYGVAVSTDNDQSITQSQVVLFAVNPQVLADVCKPLSAVDFSDKLIISIAAGISTARLAELLPTAKSIVRVMPNTPEIDRTFAEDLLSSVGKTTWVTNEGQMHAVTAASGSSPAYFFQFLEAMQQGLMEMGLDENQSRELVQQAMLGSAKLVIENPQTALSTLRENVTSKGGTTAAALNVFNQHQFNDIIKQAMQACVARSQEMEKLF